MSWNYRVMIKDEQFAIHEVFYREDGSVKGYTEDHVFPRASTFEELAEELQRCAEALSKPALPHT